MNLSHLLTASLAAALVCFIGGAEASPHFQSLMVSPLTVPAGLKCGLVNGQLVCGNTNGSGKHNDDSDDSDDNDDDHHQGKNKHHDNDDSGLENCTIQQPGGGGGCKGGFKRVCEKLKNGKKCCGCVVDKNAPPPPPPSPNQTLGPEFRCVTTTQNGPTSSDFFAANAGEALAKFEAELKSRNLTATSDRTCNPLPPR
jgi:hypothetical protein